jgi:hypothetical protein
VRWSWLLVLCACHGDTLPHGDVARAQSWHTWATLDTHAWLPTEQLFEGAPAGPPRQRTPRPVRTGDRIEIETLPVTFDVLFDPAAARHVREHGLASKRTLASLATFPAFPRQAAIVKLVWYQLDASHTLPVWDGERGPDRTWTRTVHVDDLDAFIHDGDRVLVGAHITTKALPDWTWATFWWHDGPSDAPAEVTGAARHYRMCAAFEAGEPCFNPWLEGRFPDGDTSSCLTCHQRAVVGATDYLPVTHGRLAPDDPYFRGRLATDFVWSIALEAH